MQTASAPPIVIRNARPSDQKPLYELIDLAAVFSGEEIACARELVDEALAEPERPDNYRILVAEVPEDGSLAGYVMYGPVPFTRSSWDLYWLASHPNHRRRGAARQLCDAMEEELRSLGATLVRIDTSGTPGYAAARAFYERVGYTLAARIDDFYKPNDALYLYVKRL